MTIKRYSISFSSHGAELRENPHSGDFVHYDDHLAALRREREPVAQPDALALVAAAYRDAAGVLDDHGDSAVTEALGHQLCCNGHQCGCQGADVGEYLQHIIKQQTPADATAALAAIERAAYERGVRDAVQVLDERLDGASTYGEWAQGWIAGVSGTRAPILALLTQEGR